MKKLSLIFFVLFVYGCTENEVDKSKRNDNESSLLSDNFNEVFKLYKRITLRVDDDHIISNVKKICSFQNKFVVADSRGKQLLVFNMDGELERSIGSIGSGPGEYLTVFDIDISKDGIIYVLDIGNQRVSKYKINGEYNSVHNITSCFSIVTDKSGGFYLYNPSESSFGEKNVLKHYDKNGQFLNAFCPPFFEIGMVGANPIKDYKGNIYVFHSSKYVIKKFTDKGNLIKEFGIIPRYFKELKLKNSFFPEQTELDAYTPLTKVLVTKKYILVEISRTQPKSRWLDIYSLNGDLRVSGIKVNTDLYLGTVDENDIVYFVKNPSDDSVPTTIEVPDYEIIGYKIK